MSPDRALQTGEGFSKYSLTFWELKPGPLKEQNALGVTELHSQSGEGPYFRFIFRSREDICHTLTKEGERRQDRSLFVDVYGKMKTELRRCQMEAKEDF